MSYGTEFTADAYISREHYERPEDVKEAIEELKSGQHTARTRITALACATPRDIAPADEDPLEYVQREIDDLLEEVMESEKRLTMLELLLDNFETRTLV